MMPWQIYADYLEDKGIDVRLFRLVEPKMQFDNGGAEALCMRIHRGDGCFYGDGDGSESIYVPNLNGWGFGSGYGNSDGQGNGCGHFNNWPVAGDEEF